MAKTSKFQALMGAGVVALALCAGAPSLAVAQEAAAESGESAMRLTGGVRLSAAYDPIDIAIPELIAAPAGQAALTGDGRAKLAEPADTEGTSSALPWYQRFTVAPSEPQILWSDAEAFEMQAGDRWGVTLGYSQGERSPQSFDLEDFRAGAFFELTERVRLGGQLRFTSPEEEIFGEETEERAPEIRFESAFKF